MEENRPRTDSFQSVLSDEGKNEGIINCPVCFENVIEYYTSPCYHSWCNTCHNQLLDNKCVVCRKVIDDLPFVYKTVRTTQGWRLISVYVKEEKPPPLPPRPTELPPPPPRTPRARARHNIMEDCCIIF
jgi:hypothetical protein